MKKRKQAKMFVKNGGCRGTSCSECNFHNKECIFYISNDRAAVMAAKWLKDHPKKKKKSNGGFTPEKWNAKMKELGTFYDWEEQGDCLKLPSLFANVEFFINLGKLQEAIQKAAYFQQGHSGIPGLSLCLDDGKVLNDLWGIVKDLEEL